MSQASRVRIPPHTVSEFLVTPDVLFLQRNTYTVGSDARAQNILLCDSVGRVWGVARQLIICRSNARGHVDMVTSYLFGTLKETGHLMAHFM